MESKHTPGPWRLSYAEESDDCGKLTRLSYVAAEGGGYVPIRTPFRPDAFSGSNRSDHPEEEVAANARLIAAAPEMAELLADADRKLELLIEYAAGDWVPDAEDLEQFGFAPVEALRRQIKAVLSRVAI